MNELKMVALGVGIAAGLCWIRYLPMVGSQWHYDDTERDRRLRVRSVLRNTSIAGFAAFLLLSAVLWLTS